MTQAVTEPAVDAGPAQDGGATGAAASEPRPSLALRLHTSLYVRLLGTQASDRYWGWMGPALITIFGGFIRFYRLGNPPRLVFDEAYYVRQGVSMLLYGYEQRFLDKVNGQEIAVTQFEAGTPNVFKTGTDQADFVVHPPLGKWMIALGERIFGMDNPFGWRFVACLCGTLSILMIARIARRLFGSTLLGCVAGLLLAIDGNHIAHSRTSLLDIFVMFWALAAFGCLLIDRDVSRARLAGLVEAGKGNLAGRGPWLGVRWWRLAGFACVGATAGVKWSGIYFGVVFAVMSVLWDWSARRAAGVRHWWFGAYPTDELLRRVSVLVHWKSSKAERAARRAAGTERPDPLGDGFHWTLSLVFVGLAAAFWVLFGSHWSGKFGVALTLLIALVGVLLDLGAHADGDRGWWRKAFPVDTIQAMVSFLLVVPGVYLFTWTGWFLSKYGWDRHYVADNPNYGPSWIPGPLRDLWHYHREAYKFHVGVHDSHPYMANPWSWIVSGRPTAFWYESPKLGEKGCKAAECTIAILPIGNPVIWWGGTLALLVLLFCWALRRDWRAGAILAGIVGGYLPWFQYQDRTIFQFYAIAFNPWMVLATTYVIALILGKRTDSAERRANGAILAGAIVVAACVLFVWFYPVNVGLMIPKSSWEARMWLPSWI